MHSSGTPMATQTASDLNQFVFLHTADSHVADSTDYDDLNLNINPAALQCDGVDNNCNGLTDAPDPNVNGLMLYYEDLDGDGYGDSSSVLACGIPSSGYVDVGGDCDDLVQTPTQAQLVWDCELGL